MTYDEWDSAAGKLLLHVTPVLPSTPCSVVFGYFEQNPDIPGIPVTTEGLLVVGLISRIKCLSMLAKPLMLDLYSKRPVRLIMDAKPMLVPVTASLDEVTLLLASDPKQATSDGFILCDHDYYVGMGKVSDLLALTAEQNKQRAEVVERARREAEESSRYRGEFLANMSHEIRTPMNAIMGMTQLALRLDLPPQARNYLGKILSASDSLLGIINDVLDFSKIDAGRMTIESVPFELDSVMRDVAATVELRASDKGLEFLTAIDPRIPTWLEGDPLRLRQILLNLCSNAIKFTEQGEVVVDARLVSSSDHEVSVKFSVRDSGIGLSADQIANLFQAFTQADSSTTRRYGGTGLGLAICKQLTELMGGSIGVESVVGQGSSFWFQLSLPSAAAPPSPVQPIDIDFSSLRMLVADDNPSARTIFADYLSAVGIDVEVVASGYEALAALTDTTKSFDAILLDWKMPGLDGFQTIEKMQQLDPGIHRPEIIMISAYDRDEVLNRSQAMGLSAFLIKPFSQRALLDTLRSALGKSGDHATGSMMTGGENIQVSQWQGVPILLVDDNELNQELATELLQQAGFVVTVADNGQSAVDHVKRDSFACVLMDIQMPIMDGYTATRTIRSMPDYVSLPIIAMTADAMERDHQRAMDAGMNDYISKPIDIDKMFNTLRKWIKPPL